MATIVIGRKELFSFAERHSARRLSDYGGLADGTVLCCLFNLVFPELRVRPAAPQTHSTTQCARLNWEQLFRRFARLCIPLAFLQPTALAANDVECGFSTLVLFYFLHNLSKRADFSSEFALDVAEGVTQYLQSTDCIVSLLLGNALSWSAIPDALAASLQRSFGFTRSEEETLAAENAAAEFYRSSFTHRGRRRDSRPLSAAAAVSRDSSSDSGKSERPSLTTAGLKAHAERRGAPLSSASGLLHPSLRPAYTADYDAASSEESGGGSPPPRAPTPAPATQQSRAGVQRLQRASSTPVASSAASSSSSSRDTCKSTEADFDASLEVRSEKDSSRGGDSAEVPRRLLPAGRRTAASTRSAASSSSSLSAAACSVDSSGVPSGASRTARGTQRLTTPAPPADPAQSAAVSGEVNEPAVRTAYRAAPSVAPRESAQVPKASPAAATAHSAAQSRRESSLAAALQAKEEECEALQLRVAQLLSLVASMKTTAMSTTASPPPSEPTAQLRQRIRELEAEVAAAANRHVSPPPVAAVPQSAGFDDVEADIDALTADITDEETGDPVDVNAAANLLHCLLLEQLQDSPRNCAQMQRWLWTIVAAHHTLEGRLLAAVELLRTSAAQNEQRAGSYLPETHHSDARSKPRSHSTVAAPLLPDESTSSPFSSYAQSPPLKAAVTPPTQSESPLGAAAAGEGSHEERLAQLRSTFYAELERLHTREHELTSALRAAHDARQATVQRAVRRERRWKQLCTAVYAAEQASFHMADCDTAGEIEACLQERDAHYKEVEALTEQLMKDSQETEKEISVEGKGVYADGEEGPQTPCAALRSLVSHLEAERGELLRDIARLHSVVTALQAKGKTSASALPAPPTFRPLFSFDAPPMNLKGGAESSPFTAAGRAGARLAQLPKGLASLLRGEEAPLQPVM